MLKNIMQYRGGLTLCASLLFIAACGATIDQKSEGSSGGSSDVSVRLAWPDGYVYDSAVAALQKDSPLTALSAPSYVTKIVLQVSGTDMEPMTVDIPLDTLTAAVTVTLGERTFAVSVATVSGLTFTGSRTVTIGAYSSGDMVIPLEINAPPVIERIDVTPSSPQRGDLVTATAVASDPDADDVLTYRWDGRSPETGGGVTLFGRSVSQRAQICGEQPITLTVSDDKGGSASRTFSITVPNAAPVVTGVTVNNLTGAASNPKHYDDLKSSCSVYDPDGDTFEISFRLANGTIDGGPDSQMNYNVRGGGEISCWAVDSCDARSNTATLALNGGGSMRPGPVADFDTNYASSPFTLSLSVPAYKDVDLKLINEATNVAVWYGHFKGSDGTDLNNDYGCDTTANTEKIFVPNSAFSTANTYRVEVASPNSTNCPAGGNISTTLSIGFSAAHQYWWVSDSSWSAYCTTGSCTVPITVNAGARVISRFTIGP